MAKVSTGATERTGNIVSKDEQLSAIRHCITEAIDMLTKPKCTSLRQPEWLRPETVIEKLKEAIEECTE